MFNAKGRPTGEWEGSGTRYNPPDIASHDGATFVCTAYHRSSNDFDADRALGYWQIFSTVNTESASAISVTPVGGVAATTVQGAITELDSEKLAKAANLSDLANVATARTNMGVTATGADTAYAFRAANLSDLANVATARTNLGLGAIALRPDIVNADVNASAAIDTTKLSYLQAGTGANARTVQDRLRDWVSIKDFSNDAAGITAALAAHTGVVAPPGTYNTTTARTVGSGKHLDLMPGAVLTSSGAGSWALAAGGSVHSKTEGIEGNVHYWGRNFSGAVNAGPGPLGGYSPSAFHFSVQDSATAPDVATDPFIRGLLVDVSTAANITGGRNGVQATLRLSGTPATEAGAQRFYTSFQSTTHADVNLNGTNTGAGALGAVFGGAMAAYALAAATNLNDFVGAEINTFAKAGATKKYHSGLTIACFNAERGTTIDSAIRISGGSDSFAAHAGFKSGITFTNANGADPFYASSKLIDHYWTGGGTKTIDTGIDLSGFQFTNSILRGVYSKLFEHGLTLGDSAGTAIINVVGASSDAEIVFKTAGTAGIKMRDGGDRHLAVFTRFASGGAGTESYLEFVNNNSGAGPVVAVSGGDTNINLTLQPKGTGVVSVTTGLTTPALTLPAWTQTTPTPTASSGSITSASSTIRAGIRGKDVQASINVVVTTNGTGAGTLQVTLPVAPKTSGAFVCGRNSSTGALILAVLTAASTTLGLLTEAGAYPIASGQEIQGSLSYEAN